VVFWLILVALLNFGLGFALAVYLHCAPALDPSAFQVPCQLTLRRHGRLPLPDFRFRLPITDAAIAEMNAAELAELEAPSLDTPLPQEQLVLVPADDDTICHSIAALPLSEVMRNLSQDLAAFRQSLGRIERDLRSQGESASAERFAEMIEQIRSCNADWSTRQLRVAHVMGRRTEATEAEQSIARELADVLLDVALEVSDAAANPVDEIFTKRNEAWHLLSEVHRHCRFAFTLNDRMQDWWCRIPRDDSVERTYALTQLDNRIALEEALPGFAERARNSMEGFAAVLIDIDRFQLINTRWGLEIGDGIVQSLSNALAMWVPELLSGSHLFQVSHTMFVILMEQPVSESLVEAVETLRQTVESTTLALPTDECVLSVSCAIGPAKESQATVLLAQLRKVLSTAKRHGRNRTSVHDGNSSRLVEPLHTKIQARQLPVTLASAPT
jgi:diguanylate cyclase (GGDEF)-like protein